MYSEEQDSYITLLLPIRWYTWALLLLWATAMCAHRNPFWRIPSQARCPGPAVQSRQEMRHINANSIPTCITSQTVPHFSKFGKKHFTGSRLPKVTWLSSMQTIGGLLLVESDRLRITSLTWKRSPSNLGIATKPRATFFEERNSTLQTMTWGHWAKISSNSATETYFWA